MKKNGAGIFFIIDHMPVESAIGIICKTTNKDTLEVAGGRVDKGDKCIIHTAVREATEEMGLDKNIIPSLVDYIKKNKYSITLRNNNDTFYTMFIVKIIDFDFNLANKLANKRLSECKKKGIKHSVYTEMEGYMPICIYKHLYKKEKEVNNIKIRKRDSMLLHNNKTIPVIAKLLMDSSVEPFDSII